MAKVAGPFWDCENFRLAPTAHSLSLGDKALLFDEMSQQLHEQNETSTAIWKAICREGTLVGAANLLAEDPADYASILGYIKMAALDWLRLGLLRPETLHDDRPVELVSLAWRGRGVEVRLRGSLQGQALRKVFQPFVSRVSPGRWLGVEEVGGLIFVSDDRGRCYARWPDEWIPDMKARFTETILEAAGPGFLVHGALMSCRGEGLLICGEPGAGKTTLSVSLMLAGFGYHSDDIVWIGDAGEVAGVPFAPALKQGSWPLVEEMDGGLPMSATYLRSDGQRVRYVLERPVETTPIRLRSILLLARQAGGDPRIEPVTGLEVLTTILGSAYSAKGSIAATTLKALVGSIETARTARLCASDWRETCRLVEEFAA